MWPTGAPRAIYFYIGSASISLVMHSCFSACGRTAHTIYLSKGSFGRLFDFVRSVCCGPWARRAQSTSSSWVLLQTLFCIQNGFLCCGAHGAQSISSDVVWAIALDWSVCCGPRTRRSQSTSSLVLRVQTRFRYVCNIVLQQFWLCLARPRTNLLLQGGVRCALFRCCLSPQGLAAGP